LRKEPYASATYIEPFFLRVYDEGVMGTATPEPLMLCLATIFHTWMTPAMLPLSCWVENKLQIIRKF